MKKNTSKAIISEKYSWKFKKIVDLRKLIPKHSRYSISQGWTGSKRAVCCELRITWEQYISTRSWFGLGRYRLSIYRQKVKTYKVLMVEVNHSVVPNTLKNSLAVSRFNHKNNTTQHIATFLHVFRYIKISIISFLLQIMRIAS